MNIIRTVGDLKKALSVYDNSLPLNFVVSDGIRYKKAVLNNDTLIQNVIEGDRQYLSVCVIEQPPIRGRD